MMVVLFRYRPSRTAFLSPLIVKPYAKAIVIATTPDNAPGFYNVDNDLKDPSSTRR
jgi:hypothetical protein